MIWGTKATLIKICIGNGEIKCRRIMIPAAPNRRDKIICWYTGLTIQTFVWQYELPLLRLEGFPGVVQVKFMPICTRSCKYQHFSTLMFVSKHLEGWNLLTREFEHRRIKQWRWDNSVLCVTATANLVGWLCWGLTSQSTIFQSYRDGAIASWVSNQYFRGVKCLAQGHNTAVVTAN